MKPIKKNKRYTIRRENTLARLEKYLEGGVKRVLVESDTLGAIPMSGIALGKFYVEQPFTEIDRERIGKEMRILRERLGIGDVFLKSIGVQL